MASRENQGLQVALILLVMLTIGLCVTTFVFYSKASSRYAEAEDAREAKQTAENERNQSNYQNQMLTYMMDGGAETWTAMAEQLDTYPVGDDPKINAIREEFKQDMLLFGGPDEPFEKARNYQTLPEFLMARVRDLNQQLADLRQSENRLTAEKAQLEQAAAERTQNFEQAQKKAADDLLAEREKFNQDRAKLEQEKMAIASQLTEKDNKIAELQAAMDTLKQETEKQLVDMGRILDDQKQQIKQFSRTSFEVPDAEITRGESR
jgi:Ca2+/Na+ antiporter